MIRLEDTKTGIAVEIGAEEKDYDALTSVNAAYRFLAPAWSQLMQGRRLMAAAVDCLTAVAHLEVDDKIAALNKALNMLYETERARCKCAYHEQRRGTDICRIGEKFLRDNVGLLDSAGDNPWLLRKA